MARNNYENLKQPTRQPTTKPDIDQVYFSKLLSHLNEFRDQLSVLQCIEDTKTKYLTKFHCQEMNRHAEQIIRHINTVMVYCKKDIESTDKAKQDQNPLFEKQTTQTKIFTDDSSAENDVKVRDLIEKSITAIENETIRDRKVERTASMKYIQHWETILDKQHIHEPVQNNKHIVGSDLVKKRVNQFNKKERRKSSTVFSYLHVTDDAKNNDKEKNMSLYKYRSEPRGLNELYTTTINESKEESTENNISLKEVDCLQVFSNDENINEEEISEEPMEHSEDTETDNEISLNDNKPKIVEFLLKKPGMQ